MGGRPSSQARGRLGGDNPARGLSAVEHSGVGGRSAMCPYRHPQSPRNLWWMLAQRSAGRRHLQASRH